MGLLPNFLLATTGMEEVEEDEAGKDNSIDIRKMVKQIIIF